MKLAKRTILGLTIEERIINCAQLAVSGKRRTVQRLARFEIPDGVSIEQPQALGEKLGAFLRDHHMHGATAVVGVPARWVLTQDRELPPTDAAAAISMLRLQTERLAVEEMVFDVAGPLAGSQTRRVMLVGILQRQLDRVTKMCEAAGLKLERVMPTAMALAQMVPTDDRPLVVYGESSAEVVWQQAGTPLMLKHLAADSAAPGPGVATVGSQLRRTLLLRSGGTAPSGFLLWNERSLSDQQFDEIRERSGLKVERVRPLASMGTEVAPQALNGESGRRQPEVWLPAIAVALSAAGGDGEAPVNLLHTRLVEPKPRRINRQTLLIAGAIAACVLGLVSLYITVVQREAEVAALNAEYKSKEPEIKAARASLDRFSYGRTYFEQRPPMLDCLREIASAFGTDGSIWATSFSLRDNRKGILQGRATNQQVVLQLRDKLQANKRFADLSGEIREGTGNQRDVVFTLTFTYTGRE